MTMNLVDACRVGFALTLHGQGSRRPARLGDVRIDEGEGVLAGREDAGLLALDDDVVAIGFKLDDGEHFAAVVNVLVALPLGVAACGLC
jgi:hypothetical protein